MSLAFQLSPGVVSREIDLTTIVPQVGSTGGAFAGDFRWGPINQIITVDSEITLVNKFQTPDSNTYIPFFTAANFLSYGNNLQVVRTANVNSTLNATVAGTGYLIQNGNKYLVNYYGGQVSSTTGVYAARYGGTLGNTIKISECLSANAYSATMAATATTNTGNATITFSSNVKIDANRTLAVGDYLKIGNNGTAIVSAIDANGTNVTVNSATMITQTLVANTATGSWYYGSYFNGPPGTSNWATSQNGTNDEMHIIVIDEDGRATKTANTVLETWSYVSKASDAKNDDGTTNYYRDVLFNRSNWIYWMGHNVAGTNWGARASQTAYTVVNGATYYSLAGGVTGLSDDAAKINGYALFQNADLVDISLIMGGDSDATVASYLIQNIAATRKDCVAFISPPQSSVVDNAGNEDSSSIAYRNTLPSSSYAFMDSGWKLQFDKYNGVYRYVPMNGDTAGLAVRTDQTTQPWYSIAGFNRGQINNVTQLSWNPGQTARDNLYKNGINSIVTFPGEGTILYGDKTLLSKPSAFDRINVRRLFIVLEKSIAKASKYSLFEFNDAFTRAQFVAMVEPFLRSVKGARGIYDFKVICDTTNNTPQVIDSNGFVGDIYIKPARSINFITLNFIATSTGVSFTEVQNQFG